MKKNKPDPYALFINDNWDIIIKAYNIHREINPIIECDLNMGKIYAYAGLEYLAKLSDRTREETKDLFLKTCSKGKLMIFIRDTLNRQLRSYVYSTKEKGK